MSNHSTSTSIEKSLIQAFSDKPIAVILPVHLKLAGDYATAAALAQILYWRKKQDKEFYKKDIGVDKDGVDRSWCTELMLTITQWKTVKAKLKQLPFLKIVTKGIPPVTFYDVDYRKLGAAIAEFQPKKSNKANKTSFKATNHAIWRHLPLYVRRDMPPFIQRDLPLNVSRDLPPHNTENTQRLLKDNNNGAVVVEKLIEKEPEKIPVENDIFMKLFSVREQLVAKKLISELSAETQVEVLEYMQHKIDTKQIKSSKTGYLKTVVDSVEAGTFVPLAPKEKKLTVEERIAKEKVKEAEEKARAEVNAKANDVRLKEMEKEVLELKSEMPVAAMESLKLARLALRGGKRSK
jgi:hypothetical protein